MQPRKNEQAIKVLAGKYSEEVYHRYKRNTSVLWEVTRKGYKHTELGATYTYKRNGVPLTYKGTDVVITSPTPVAHELYFHHRDHMQEIIRLFVRMSPHLVEFK